MGGLKFHSIYQERVWGGRNFEKKLARTALPPGKKVGESWEIIDRTRAVQGQAVSAVAQGPFEGSTLSALMTEQREWIMGPHYPKGKPFPILVKWLDCQERLSLQVHPPLDVASRLGGEPKSENWYFYATEPDAVILVGLKKGVTRSQFKAALANNDILSLVHCCKTRPGDSLFIPSGRVHAIGGGNLILEIQQNSDTTYRVHDWGRVGLDGNPRQLHIEASLQSIDFYDNEPVLIHRKKGRQRLVDSPYFRIQKWDLSPDGAPLQFTAKQQPRLLHGIRGRLEERHGKSPPLHCGDTLLLPFAENFCFYAVEEATTVLVTDQFVPSISS